jgi:hypothetical protein
MLQNKGFKRIFGKKRQLEMRAGNNLHNDKLYDFNSTTYIQCHVERMKEMRNTKSRLIEKPEGQIQFMGTIIRKKETVRAENGFGGEIIRMRY